MKCATFLLATFCLSCTGLSAQEIYCHAAISLSDVLTHLGKEFTNQTKQKVIFNFGASSFVARQLEEGAPGDLFLSADEEKMNQLETEGLLNEKTRKRLLSNTLVIVARRDSVLKLHSPKDLLAIKGRIAIAEFQSVPAGIYARKYLTKVGIWQALFDRLVPVQNVRAALGAVESGNVEAGIVYKTDTKLSKIVKIIYHVPAKEGPYISYSIARLKNSRNPDKAGHFYDYLLSPAATKVFSEYGFIPLMGKR